jgi:hypothetical protein
VDNHITSARWGFLIHHNANVIQAVAQTSPEFADAAKLGLKINEQSALSNQPHGKAFSIQNSAISQSETRFKSHLAYQSSLTFCRRVGRTVRHLPAKQGAEAGQTGRFRIVPLRIQAHGSVVSLP